jgi:hypothetical protein
VDTRESPAPPRLWVLIDEGVLHRPVAPAPVLHDQFEHLVATSMLPNVTIQVVPYAAGGHTGLLGAFMLADLPTAQSIVFVEDVSGGHVAEDATVVDEVTLCFESIRSDALPKVASRDLIARMAKETWTA